MTEPIQSGLFDRHQPFPHRQRIAANADPATSHAAAHELTKSGKRATQKATVLRALEIRPWSTSAELARVAKLDRHMVARRLPDLEADGLVVRQPVRNCNVTGKLATTWRATE